MTTEMNIEVTNETLEQLNYIMDARNLPKTKTAFNKVVHNVKAQWQSWAGGASIDGIDNIKYPNAKIQQSIKTKELGDFHAEVYSNNKYMERIETGTPSYDMKKTYPYGKKSRVGKSGIPYLIIPFRWGAGKERAHFRGNVAPDYLVDYLKKLQISQRLNTTHAELNYNGEAIQRAEYNWGGRVTEEIAQDDRQVGMVRMRDLNDKGTYFTFRIISPLSPAESWIRKEVKAIPVTQTIANNNQVNAEKALSEALAADIRGL